MATSAAELSRCIQEIQREIERIKVVITIYRGTVQMTVPFS